MESADRMIWILIPGLSSGKAIPIAAACCANSSFDRKLQGDEGLERQLFCFCYFEGGGVAHSHVLVLGKKHVLWLRWVVIRLCSGNSFRFGVLYWWQPLGFFGFDYLWWEGCCWWQSEELSIEAVSQQVILQVVPSHKLFGSRGMQARGTACSGKRVLPLCHPLPPPNDYREHQQQSCISSASWIWFR